MTGPVGEAVMLSGNFNKMARSGLILKMDT